LQIGRGWGISFASILLISSWCLARFIIENKPLKLIYFLYFLFSVYFYISIFLLNLTPASLVVGSHNRISTLVLSFGVLIYFLDPNIRTIHVINIFIVCLVSQGSAGIITSFFLAMLVFVKCYKANIFFWIFFLIIASTSFGYIIYNISQESFLFETLSKLDFGRLTGEDVRFSIANEYLLRAQDSYINFFTGVKSWSYVGESIYNNEVRTLTNLHNSYLDAHLSYGIFGIFMNLLVFFILYKTTLNSYFHSGLLFVVLLRAFADTNFIISGYFNFVILIFLVSIYSDYFNSYANES